MVTRAVQATKVYPRVCGGSVCVVIGGLSSLGLSPRVRGKLLPAQIGGGLPRSIPACAGEAPICSPPTSVAAVYPRVCGGSLHPGIILGRGAGLSPRVRGKRIPPRKCNRTLRSIPACAGEASGALKAKWARAVYPRVCGGSEVRIGVAIG